MTHSLSMTAYDHGTLIAELWRIATSPETADLTCHQRSELVDKALDRDLERVNVWLDQRWHGTWVAWEVTYERDAEGHLVYTAVPGWNAGFMHSTVQGASCASIIAQTEQQFAEDTR